MPTVSVSNVFYFGLQNEEEQSSPLDCGRLQNVIKYIKANLDEQITIKKIAGIAGMKGQSFCRFLY